MAGRSLLDLLTSRRSGTLDRSRDAVFAARERHSSARPNNWGYPSRAIRTGDYLYVRNFHPERWPAGDPRTTDEEETGFHDIDDSPTKSFLLEHRDDPQYRRFFELAVGKRPPEELYDVRKDPGCLDNLAESPRHAATRKRLRAHLEAYLTRTGDPRMGTDPEIWETYPRYSPSRSFSTD
jgi:N-sulfoglucosamine sulfohydrolase